MDKIDLSVLMVCYNHEKYIEAAISSIANQKTKYRFEIIVGDDCSNDRTQEIVVKMQQRYPGIVKAMLRGKNVGATKNSYDILSKAEGEYIAFCDGDDMWIDGNRIDEQIDFLKQHPEYSAICGKTRIIDEKGDEVKNEKVNGIDFWSYENKVYELKEYENWKMPGHISAILGKNFFNSGDCSLIYKVHDIVGDRTDVLLFLQDGPIYCSDDFVSCYRLKLAGDNFVSQYKKNNLRYEDFCMMKNLETGLLETRGARVNLSSAKKQRFVGAIVTWMKDKSDYNRRVIEKIYSECDNRIKYKKLYYKTILLKNFYWNVLHKDKSINF